MTALQRIDSFEEGRPFGPWFFRILVNRGLNARKRRALRATDVIPDGTATALCSPDRDAERGELRDRLRAAMERLPERQRVIVQLFELEGTVRWHLHEARRALRADLAPYRRMAT